MANQFPWLYSNIEDIPKDFSDIYLLRDGDITKYASVSKSAPSAIKTKFKTWITEQQQRLTAPHFLDGDVELVDGGAKFKTPPHDVATWMSDVYQDSVLYKKYPDLMSGQVTVTRPGKLAQLLRLGGLHNTITGNTTIYDTGNVDKSIRDTLPHELQHGLDRKTGKYLDYALDKLKVLLTGGSLAYDPVTEQRAYMMDGRRGVDINTPLPPIRNPRGFLDQVVSDLMTKKYTKPLGSTVAKR